MGRMLMLIVLFFAAGCSSSNSAGGTSAGTSGTPMQGTWSITGTAQCDSMCGSGVTGSYQVVFVSSPCSISSPVGTFSVQGNVCFTANNNSAQGAISGKGLVSNANNNGVGVLAGTASNPVPDGATINLVFVLGSGSNFYEFTGTATITKGTMQGTGDCSADTPSCKGVTATFSGTQQ